MEDEIQSYDEGLENASQDNHKNQPNFSEEFAAIKAELESLKSSAFAQQTSAPQQAQAPQLTAEQAQALRDNPDLMAKWLQAQANEAKNEIRKESSKQIWDTRTYDKFPLIKTDKEFAKRVTSQMREMISQGEYGKDDPMLLYRAAQITAAEYAPARSTANRTSQAQSSVESRPMGQRNDPAAKTKIDDNDPRMHFARVLGLQGDKLKRFKESLGPYTPSQRRQARRLSK